MPILVLIAQCDHDVHVHIARKGGKNGVKIGRLEPSDNRGSSGWFHI